MSNQRGWTTQEKVDWAKVPDKVEFVPLEPGIYFAKLTECTPEPTNAGKPAARLVMIVDQKHGGPAGELKRKVRDMLVIDPASEFTLTRTKNFSAALGIDMPESNGFEDVEAWSFNVLEAGKAGIWVELKTELYQGRPQQRVKCYHHSDKVDEAAAELAGTAQSAADATASAAAATPPRRKR